MNVFSFLRYLFFSKISLTPEVSISVLDEASFWNIIIRFDWNKTGDDQAVIAPACKALSNFDDAVIFRFADILTEKLHSLDTREHCRACYAGEFDPDNGDDYISADGFLYARCAVVANGKDYYESVLADPRSMPQDLEFESLLYVPQVAYELKCDKAFDHASPLSYESFQNSTGWKPNQNTKPGKFNGENIPPGNRRPT